MERMLSLNDMEEARAEALNRERLAAERSRFQIRISLGSCGIAAGAEETLRAIHECTKDDAFRDVRTKIIGCTGLCAMEPIVQVVEADRELTTYGKVTPPVVERIFQEHIEKHLVVQEYVVENL